MDVAWNPFSTGPHNCIGQGLAMQELHTVLAVFLSKFEFELPGEMQTLPNLFQNRHIMISNEMQSGCGPHGLINHSVRCIV